MTRYTYKQQLNERSLLIDSIKAVAIFFVVITHCNWPNQDRLRYGFPFWIDTAMPIFMFLSAYLYSQSFEKSQIVTLKSAYNISLLERNLIRFLLPFLLLTPIDIFCNIYMHGSQNLSHLLVFLIGGGHGPGSYYVPMMVQFVALFPLLFILIKKSGKLGLLCCIGVNIIYEYICTLFDHSLLARSSVIVNLVYRLCIARYIGLLGIGIYAIFCKVKLRTTIPIIIAMIIGGGGWLYLVNYGKYDPVVFTRWKSVCLPAGLFSVSIIIFILSFLQCKWDSMRLSIIRFIGSSSYEIFLAQKLFYAIQGILLLNISPGWKTAFANIIICSLIGVMYKRYIVNAFLRQQKNCFFQANKS